MNQPHFSQLLQPSLSSNVGICQPHGKLRIEAAADADTQEAAQWYEQQRAGLGLEFLVAVDEAIQRIGRSPERFPRLETLPEEEFVRRHVLSRFP